MLKAAFSLPNGTSVTIEGTDMEGTREAIKNILDYYSNSSPVVSPDSTKPNSKVRFKASEKKSESSDTSKVSPDTLTQIIHTIKTCPEAEAIERNILGKAKPAEADRVLLPLYIIHEHFENAFGLTTVEIETVTRDLGRKIKVSRQNANRQFVRTGTTKYVLGDKRRQIGAKIRYTLNTRGVQYIKSVLEKAQVEE
jgi:hypothetical protein